MSMTSLLTPVTIAACVGLVGAGACGPSRSNGNNSTGAVETTMGNSTGTTSGETTRGPPDGCACVPGDSGDLGCSDVVDCGTTPICPFVGYTCPRDNHDLYSCQTEYVYDEAALSCALQALRDRSVGILLGGGETDLCGLEGCGSTRFQISILGEDEATFARCTADPLGDYSVSAYSTTLASPDFFQSCLEVESPAERYDCLFGGLEGRQSICN